MATKYHVDWIGNELEWLTAEELIEKANNGCNLSKYNEDVKTADEAKELLRGFGFVVSGPHEGIREDA